jgi:hypothetical protein
VNVTFTNSAATIAQLTIVGGATGQSVTGTIAVGATTTPTSGTGQVQFDPLAAGTTTVSVVSSGAVSGANATRSVTVNP